MRPAPTRFARSGDARIAYQVFGQGSVDLVVVGGLASHLDLQWDEPSTVRLFERFASYVRLVRFDRRGTGHSDPTEGPPTLEQQMEDLDAVMDAAGLTRAALLGAVEAGLCAMYAASYPERVSALVLVNVAPAGALGGAAPQFRGARPLRASRAPVPAVSRGLLRKAIPPHCPSHQRGKRLLLGAFLASSGGGGIRTLDGRENAHNGFRDRRIQPLCHPSR